MQVTTQLQGLTVRGMCMERQKIVTLTSARFEKVMLLLTCAVQSELIALQRCEMCDCFVVHYCKPLIYVVSCLVPSTGVYYGKLTLFQSDFLLEKP